MKAFTYIKHGEFGFTEKEKPTMIDAHDAIVRVTLSSICTSDLHIKHVLCLELCQGLLLAMKWWVSWKK